MQINLFDKIEEKIEEYNENKEIVIKDKDDNYIVTTFDNIIEDWGNNIIENKSYKIKNVKLKNITATLYIDYTINNNIGTISFKHGEEEIYSYTDNYNSFNLTFLGQKGDLIIFAANYCDSVDDGICQKHLTASKVVAFNKTNELPLYDNTIRGKYNSITITNDVSLFMEDEKIYTIPYNDFRVYDIKIINDRVFVYTIVENYKDLRRITSCDDKFWVASNFDIQRTFVVNFVYNDSSSQYGFYEVGNVVKQNTIKYYDYCINNNVLGF